MRHLGIGRLMALPAAGFVAALTATALAQAPAGGAASLPPAVTTAFQQAYPGANVTSTAQEREGNRTVFRVTSRDKGRQRVVLYDAGGAPIEIAEQVDQKDLPGPVTAAWRSHPRATSVSAMKVTRGKSVEYRLTLRGTRKTAMVVKPDGTVLSFK